MAAKDDLGRAGEDRAARYFEGCGFTVLDRRWRCPEGEIDLVVCDDSAVVVVEVKTRTSLAFGHPFDALAEPKRRRLRRLALTWSHSHTALVRGRTLRIDAVGIVGADAAAGTLEHLRDIA